ncbi:MAG: hypothetical protein Q9162_004736 [Coniocarpon cinnabarinum]
MPFTLKLLGQDDLPITAHIRLNAFDGVPAQRALRPQGTTPETLSWYTNKHIHEFLNDPGTFFVGVRDTESNTLIAYGQWQRDLAADRQRSEASEATKKGKENKTDEDKFSPGSNAEAQSIFWGKLAQSERDFMGETDYWHLHLLATLKQYQGRGAATMVLRWGQERAREEGLVCYLDSTADGQWVYEKVGFVKGPAWCLDLRPYGVEHLNCQWPMRWDPRSKS